MVKAIFTEMNAEYGLSMIVGEKEFGEMEVDTAHEKAKMYAGILTEVRGTEVSYMLSKDNAIIAYLQ